LEEIADVMDIGLSAAKMRLYRAMERFKMIYQDLEETP
jgi:DNA-directed RNA polymerase specialized sigma24 family protein